LTNEFKDKDNFLLNLIPRYNIENLNIKLILKEGSTLKKPLRNDDLSSGSVYPKPDLVTSDGLRLILEWSIKEISSEDEIAIFVQIKEKSSPIIFIIIAVFSILTAFFLSIKLKKKPKEIIIEKKEDLLELHLKEDEERVIKVLKLKEGSCDQGTLRIATGFPKATLSRILFELEQRKIIIKEKRGKKNKIFLKKENWNNLEQ
jgi:uncharacterized membrane protein